MLDCCTEGGRVVVTRPFQCPFVFVFFCAHVFNGVDNSLLRRVETLRRQEVSVHEFSQNTFGKLTCFRTSGSLEPLLVECQFYQQTKRGFAGGWWECVE